jgi:tripartite-type tricarboxylate transporter receptor subunit TctC
MFTGGIMRRTLVALLGALALFQAPLVLAQAYPERPVKIIVPFAPGGIADGSARVIANHLSETWSKPFLVENRPGAASIIAFTAVIKAPADGYTLLYANTNIATNPSMYTNLPYDAERDLVPVALGVVTPGVIVVHPSSTAKTLSDLIALAKEKPDQLTYSSVGVGSFPHLAMEQFQQVSGTRLTHVPYKGFAPALTAVLASEVTMLASDLQTALPHLKAGKLRALAVTASKRMVALPDVAPVADLGLPDYEAVGWLGIMAPVGTPRDIVLKLNAEIIRGLNQPQIVSRYIENGVEVGTGSPEDFGIYIQRSRARWSGVIKKGGIKGGG